MASGRIKKLSSFNLKGKKVLLRVDINSPTVKGEIEDSPRMKEAAESILYILEKGAKLAVLAHQGRKGGKDFTSLEQHAKLLTKHSGKRIMYVDALFEDKAYSDIDSLREGECILLRNVREYDDETNIKKKGNRYKQLCKHFDLFVNDAFSVCHREQGSIILPPRFLPSCMGIGMEKEINALVKLDIKGGTTYLLGGEKVEDYLPIFDNLKNKKSKVLASGVLANIMLAAKGNDLGYEEEWMNANGYMKMAEKMKGLLDKYPSQIILPVDLAVSEHGKRVELNLEDFPSMHKVMDVGERTAKVFCEHIMSSKKVFMKGPLGFSEIKQFNSSTRDVLRLIARQTSKGKLFSLIGGGHLTATGGIGSVKNKFSHVSLSGGALIAYVSGKKLPGIEALRNN